MGREGSTAHTHYAAVGYPLYNLGRTEGYLTHGIGCAVDALLPLVSLHVYHHVHHGVAGQVGVWLDGCNGTGYGAVDIGGDETGGGSYHLSDLDLIAFLDKGLGRCSQMLGHGNVHPLWQREYLYR